MRALRWVAAVLLTLLVIYGGVSLYLASKVTKGERHALEDSPVRVGLAYQDVTFKARGEDIDLRGWYMPADRDRGSIVMVHGIDSNRADPGPGYVDVVAALHARGYNVLAFDLRGHGESSDGRLSGGLFEANDVLGAYDWLVARGAPRGRVGVLGFSMGAASSTLAAAREPGIQGLVDDSPFADVRDLISSEIPKRSPAPAWIVPAFIPGMTLAAQVRYGIALAQIVPEAAVQELDYPVLLIHCRGDDRIPVEQSRRIRESAMDGSELWEAPCEKHSRAFRADPSFYTDEVDRYFAARFKGR